MVSIDPDLHRRLTEVRDVLTYSFDFEVLDKALGPEAYLTPSPWLPAFTVLDADYAIVARDAMGGVYVVCEPAASAEKCCLHIDTQGHRVALGADLDQALCLILELPYWREILTAAPSQQLGELRAAAQHLERELSDDMPALEAARADMFGTLALPRLPDPVATLLERATNKAPVDVVSPHGWEYQGLGAQAAAS